MACGPEQWGSRQDYVYPHTVESHDGYAREILAGADVNEEIQRLSAEMAGIGTRSLPFDRWDLIAVFTVGMLEVAADFLLGDPRKGLSKNLSDRNHYLGRYLNDIHENLDHDGSPLDYQGFKFGGGHHRGRTFSHDLLMFPFTLYMLCRGQFIDGYYEYGQFNWIMTRFNQHGNIYEGLPPAQAIVAYLTHMFADFCSSTSLPVPGFGLLAHAPNREIRKLVARMYQDGFNLRHMAVQGIPVLSTEVFVRIYHYLRIRGENVPGDIARHKLNRMLLMCHSLAMLVNAGKVYFTNNPAAINLPMLLRVIWLVWATIRDEAVLTHKAKVKVNLGLLRNRYRALQTMVLLDDAVCHTSDVNRFLIREGGNFRLQFEKNEQRTTEGFSDIGGMLEDFGKLNDDLRGNTS